MEPRSHRQESLNDPIADVLHNSSASRRGGLFSILGKGSQGYAVAVEEYLQAWSGATSNHVTITKRYYDLVSDFFEHFLRCQSMHIWRAFRGQTVHQNMTRHESHLFARLGLNAGDRVLDVGCGVGGPAQHIARRLDVAVTGVNFNEYQVQRARRYAQEAGLSMGRVRFVVGDFMALSSDLGGFDAAYAIEATSYAPDLERAYAEVFRVLRPGGRFAVYEMVLTDAYDGGNAEHREIRRGIERGLGIMRLATTGAAMKSLEAAGFEVEVAADLAEEWRMDEAQLPWYFIWEPGFKVGPTLGDTLYLLYMTLGIRNARSWLSLLVLRAGEMVGLLPEGSSRLVDVMVEGFQAMGGGGKLGVFTPMFMMVGRKPL